MTTFIRAFAIMLALTGFSATTYTGGTTTGSKSGVRAMDDGGAVGPISVCAPNDPTHCGMD